MSHPNPYKPRHSHPINGLSLIPQHVLAPITPSPPISRPAIDPFKAFTARDLDSFVDNITNKIRNALLGPTDSSSSEPQASCSVRSTRTSDVFGQLQSIHSSRRPSPPGSLQPLGDRNNKRNPDHHDDKNDDSFDETPIHATIAQTEINQDQTIVVSSPLGSRSSSQDVLIKKDAIHIQSEDDFNSSQSDSDLKNLSQLDDQEDSEPSNDESSDGPHSQSLEYQTRFPSLGNVSSHEEDSDNAILIDQSTQPQETLRPIPSSSPSSLSIHSLSASSLPSSESESGDLDPSLSSYVTDKEVSSSASESIELASNSSSARSQLHHSYEPEDSYESSESSSSHATEEEIASNFSGSIELASKSSSIIFQPSIPNVKGLESPLHGITQPDRLEQDDEDDLDVDGDSDIDGFEEDNQEMKVFGNTGILEKEIVDHEQDSNDSDYPGDQDSEKLEDSEDSENVPEAKEDEEATQEDQEELDLDTQLEEAGGDVALEENITQIESLAKTQAAFRSPHTFDATLISPPSLPSLELSENHKPIITPLDCRNDAHVPPSVKAESGHASDNQFGDCPIYKNKEEVADTNFNHQPSSSCPPTTTMTIQLQPSEFPVCHLVEKTDDPQAELLISHNLSSQALPLVNLNNDADTNNITERPSSSNLIIAPENNELRTGALATCSTFNPVELPSVSTHPSEKDIQSIIDVPIVEDDNDLFEGDNDLRLHTLGINHQLSKQEQNNSLEEMEDRFSSIEQKLENFLNSASNRDDPFENEVDVEKTVGQSDHSIVAELASKEAQSIRSEIQQDPQTNDPFADAVAPLAIFEHPSLLPNSNGTTEPKPSTGNALAEQTSSGQTDTGAICRTSDVETSQPPLGPTWGELSPPVTLVGAQTYMTEINFFPLNHQSQSQAEIKSVGWTKALSAGLSIEQKHVNPQLLIAPVVSLKLPQPPRFRQIFNLDDDSTSISEDKKKIADPNLKSAQSHEPEDFDMLASSITDGDSEAAPVQSKRYLVSEDNAQRKVSKEEAFTLPCREETHEETLLDPKTLVNDETKVRDDHANAHPSVQSFKFALLPCESRIDCPETSNNLLDDSDASLAQFLNSNPDDECDIRMSDPRASASPVACDIPVSAVTFAASPTTETYDNTSIPVFAPQTPLTSTTHERGTSSESSERFMSRGSASLVTYSAPSSVVSSDAPSVPASSAPPPPLSNASMGAPTEAVGLSNQITRRSSVDSSTHAEPPSPSTSTRQLSAPITQEQVNAPGLPHAKVTEVANSPQNDLPDPLRSPPLMNQHSISTMPQPTAISTSRASSMVAHPPSPSFSIPLETSSMAPGLHHQEPVLHHQDPLPPLDPRLQLSDSNTAPVPVSIPEIKLENIPIASSLTQSNSCGNLSAASQASICPQLELEKSALLTIPLSSPKETDSVMETNLQTIDPVNLSHFHAPSQKQSPSPSHILPASRSQTLLPLNRSATTDQADKNIALASEDQSVESTPPDAQTSNHDQGSSQLSIEVPLKSSEGDHQFPVLASPCNKMAVDPLDAHPDSHAGAVTHEALKRYVDVKSDPIADNSVDPSGKKSPVSTRSKRKKQNKLQDPMCRASSENIEAEEENDLDRESQLREILRQRRTSTQRAPRTDSEPKNLKKRKTQSMDARKKTKVVKRARSGSKDDINSGNDGGSNLASDASTEVELKETPIRSRLPRAAKRISNAPQKLAPPGRSQSPSNVTARSTSSQRLSSSPKNSSLNQECSNIIQPFEYDDTLLAGTTRTSSITPQPTDSSAVLPSSYVSVVVPPLKLEDRIPKLRLHQHKSTSSQVDDHQNVETSKQTISSTSETESKPAIGRGNRRKQSEIQGGRQLPPSLPPVTRSHCHFIRLKFNNAQKPSQNSESSIKIIDTFLIPQCATGNEEIKNKMKELHIVEEDNLTAEEQSRGIRIGHDGKKHSLERFEHSNFLLCLKDEYSNFSVDDDTLNILIELFGLSLIQEGQVEALLPENYFNTSHDLDRDHHHSNQTNESQARNDYLSVKKRQRTRSFDSSSSLQPRSRKSSPAFLTASVSDFTSPNVNKRRKSHNVESS